MKNKKELSEREKLIVGWNARIKMHQKQLAAQKKANREVERELEKKIRLDRLQLNALKISPSPRGVRNPKYKNHE